MKKIIFSAILAFLVVFNIQAQDEATNDNDFSKWQVRFRLLSVVPSPSDDIDGVDIDISTAITPEFDFTYFFNKNIAAELILATTKHNVDIKNGPDLGHVWLLPPTLNLQYHFYADDFKPYIGAGINYTIFYGVDGGDLGDIDYENTVGFSVQAGVDYNLNEKWFLNLDIKKLFLETDVTPEGSTESAKVGIDPLVIGLGVGMKF